MLCRRSRSSGRANVNARREGLLTSRISYTTTTTRGSRLDATDWTWHVIQQALTPPVQENEWPELVVTRECNAGGMHGVVCIAAIRHTPPAHRCLFDETFEKVQLLPIISGNAMRVPPEHTQKKHATPRLAGEACTWDKRQMQASMHAPSLTRNCGGHMVCACSSPTSMPDGVYCFTVRTIRARGRGLASIHPNPHLSNNHEHHHQTRRKVYN